jgi:nucleoside 2-deoxyribosyltransferase
MMASRTLSPSVAVSLGRDGRIAFRVRIGVTGHRHIENSEEVALAVADRLHEIQEMFAPTQSTPVVFSILSALAEGADRLVAKVALDVDSGLEVELGAVLPLALPEYREDFETHESRREFHDFLSRSTVRVELEHGPAPRGRERDAAYDRAGRYIVDHSDALIAVWDGGKSQGPGGTAEVIGYARERGVPVLVVPTEGGQQAERLSAKEVGFPGESSRYRATRDAFRRIDDYNRMSLESSRNAERIGSQQALLGKSLEGTSMHAHYMLIADWALPHLARADKLAVSNHRRQTALAWAIHLLAAFAVTDVAVQTLFLLNEPIWLIGEVLLVLILLLAVATSRFARLHDRWIGYRSLAEAFRSALFLALSGGDDRRRVTGTGVLGEPEEAWFQRAFSQAWRSSPEVALGRRDSEALRDLLVEAWIDHQIRYHSRAARRWRALHSLCTWTMGILAAATITVALLHILEVGGDGWIEDALKLSALTLPAFGGAIAGLREYGHLRLHEERSKRAITRLQGLRDRLLVSGTLASVQRLAVDAQRVMVDETLDWYGVVEFQDVDIVI